MSRTVKSRQSKLDESKPPLRPYVPGRLDLNAYLQAEYRGPGYVKADKKDNAEYAAILALQDELHATEAAYEKAKEQIKTLKAVIRDRNSRLDELRNLLLRRA